jgi:small conductance mechanosensitive channel
MLGIALGLVAAGVVGSDTDQAPAPQPVTTADPSLPSEELALLLKPLTKDQLLIEAQAWQSLVQAKAEEIALAEVAIKRQNREIDKAAAIQKQAKAAKSELEAVKIEARQARESGDGESLAKVEQAARKAREQMQALQASVDEAAEAAQATAEITETLPGEAARELDATAEAAEDADAALDELARGVEEARGKVGAELRAAAQEARKATEDAVKATEEAESRARKAAERAREPVSPAADSLARTAEVMATAAEQKKQEKVALLERLAELREQRALLLDNLKAVLTALEAKTDADDAATLAEIQDYRLYTSAVRGVDLDVKDTTSAWLAIKGWAMSEEGGIRLSLNVLTFIGILIAAWLISGVFSALIHRAMKRISGTSKLLEDFLVKAARWIVMAIGVIMALAALEISVGPLLAVVGAAGFVIAFALQDSLGNFASGIMILFFKPFDVGDVVDAGGVSGTVESMNLVSTTIKTFDNKTMVVPNNKIWGDVIVNASGVSERRVDMEFGIGYDADIDRAQSILEEVVGAHPQVLTEPAPTIRLSALGDSSVNFIVRPWAKTADYWQVYWDLTRTVKKRFDAEGIGIPFPQRDVHLYLENAAGASALQQLPGGTQSEGDSRT